MIKRMNKQMNQQTNNKVYCVTPQSVYKTFAVVLNAQMVVLEIRHV